MEIRQKKNKIYLFDTLEIKQCNLNKKLQDQFKGHILGSEDKSTTHNKKRLKEKLIHDKMD